MTDQEHYDYLWEYFPDLLDDTADYIVQLLKRLEELDPSRHNEALDLIKDLADETIQSIRLDATPDGIFLKDQRLTCSEVRDHCLNQGEYVYLQLDSDILAMVLCMSTVIFTKSLDDIIKTVAVNVFEDSYAVARVMPRNDAVTPRLNDICSTLIAHVVRAIDADMNPDEPSAYDRIEAQVLYTALMTDTLLDELED